MRAVQPGAHERLAGRRFRLGDLVLVMRKDKVDAAGVNVEARAEVFHAHRRALDMPAGSPRADLRVPARLALARSLPDREVAYVVLAVLVGLDSLTDALLRRVDVRQLPVLGPTGDAEKDGAIVRPIGVATIDERLDQRDH